MTRILPVRISGRLPSCRTGKDIGGLPVWRNTMRKMSRRFRNHRKLHRDNRGSTLLVVVLAMLMLGVLGTVSLYVTYLNYSIKITERKATNNFYTAEMVMEEIKAGLESEVSSAFADAYLGIMQNYEAYTPAERTVQFQHRYLTTLSTKLADPAHSNQVDLGTLRGYISAAHAGAAALDISPENAAGDSLIKYTDSVVIRGLELTYTNSDGYVAVIVTDIVMSVPMLLFEEDNALPDVLAYSLVAGDELHFDQGGNYQVKGNVYGGKNGITVCTAAKVSFSPTGSSQQVVATGGDVNVNGNGSPEPDLRLDAKSSFWAKGILVDSARVSLLGKSFVNDDLTVAGSGSAVKLAGTYYGFGYENVAESQYGPEDSSSILINGRQTTLDMSQLTELGLAGQAYIGVTTESTIPDDLQELNTSADIRMGESLSVQSNQIAYLVPHECIGYINGECVLGANPVNIAAYREYKDAEDEARTNGEPYAEVDLSRVTIGTGENERSLSDYGAAWQKVFYQSSSPSRAWVYYYLRFDSAEKANQFFADYYEQNKEELNEYIGYYLTHYSVPTGLTKLNLAGNAVYYDAAADGYVLEPAGYSGAGAGGGEDPADVALEEYRSCAHKYEALNVNLTMNYNALTQEQKDRFDQHNVFYNIVDVDKLRDYLGGAAEQTVTAAGGQKVLLVDNAGGEPYTLPEDSSLHAVIATGSVKVAHNFKGMILAGENIYIENGAVAEGNPNAASLALQADEGRILACFWEGNVPTPGEGTPGSGGNDGEITTSSLVSYRNWKKY